MHRSFGTVLPVLAAAMSTAGAASQPLVEDLCIEQDLPLDIAASTEFSLSSIEITGDRLILGAEFFTDPGDPPFIPGPVFYSNLPTAFDTVTQSEVFKYIPDAPFQLTMFYGIEVSESDGVLAVSCWDSDFGGPDESGAVVLFDTATGTQLSVIAPTGLDAFDRFGRDIDLTGSTLIVGASGDDSAPGDHAGAIYVFDVSDPVNPVQVHKLTPTNATQTVGMGRSVATDGATIIAGTFSDDIGAYLYDLDTGAELATMTAELEMGESVGYGVDTAVDGDIAVVGAIGDSFPVAIGGRAYIYTIADRQQPVLLAELDGEFSFGTDLALESGRLAVGGYFEGAGFGRFEVYDLCEPDRPQEVGFANVANSCVENGTVLFGQGFAFDGGKLAVRSFYAGVVYTLDPLPPCTTETLIATDKLLADAGEPVSLLGTSAALDGDLAILGAPNDGNTTSSGTGAVYLFDIDTNQQVGKLLADDAAVGAEFGNAVAAENGIVAIGARADSDVGDSAGAVYLFDTASQMQTDKLAPAGLQPFSNFGVSIAMEGNTILAGADAPGFFSTQAGAVYVFDAATGQEISTLQPTGSAIGDRFGNAVAIDGTTALIGAIGFQGFGTSNPGKAYLFDITTGQQLHELVPSVSIDGDRFGFAVALSGGYALVTSLLSTITEAETVFVFDVATGQQVGMLTDPDAVVLSPTGFGRSLAIMGDTALVGHPGGTGLLDRSTGIVHLFDLNTFAPTGRLVPANSVDSMLLGGEVDADFSEALVTDGSRLLIGAPRDGETRDLGGAGYLYGFTDDPAPCPADTNNDGLVTPADFNAWVLAFNIQAPACDQNGDGLCNPSDFNAWILNFNAGC